jgi:hypothetical protein
LIERQKDLLDANQMDVEKAYTDGRNIQFFFTNIYPSSIKVQLLLSNTFLELFLSIMKKMQNKMSTTSLEDFYHQCKLSQHPSDWHLIGLSVSQSKNQPVCL